MGQVPITSTGTFSCVVAEAPALAGCGLIEQVVALTVLLSVLLHGVTAAPLPAAKGGTSSRYSDAGGRSGRGGMRSGRSDGSQDR